jgi:glucose-6-phosphate isomerase
MAYLNRTADFPILGIRSLLASKTRIGTTFGWGPRFLHSTGQFHKGGTPNGIFIQITGDSKEDLAIPGKDFTFQRLLMAQALGDASAIESRNFPLMRIHLLNREAGIAELLDLIAKL